MNDLATILERWRGTPWRPGECCAGSGGGVDCVRFAVAVCDERIGLTGAKPIPRAAQDAGEHCSHIPDRIIALILARYGGRMKAIKGVDVESGDMIGLIRNGAKGVQHVLIAGSDRNAFWHSLMDHGVTVSGREILDGARIAIIGRLF